jgi:hypothetical protein
MYSVTEISRQYQPAKVLLLFVSEAPGGGDKHFYLGNTNLFRTIYLAFSEVFGDFKSVEDFLQFFKGTGCFLEHLTCTPIDKSSVKIRKNQRQGGIRTYQPRLIMILMKSIEQEVKESIDLSGLSFIEEIAVTCYPAGTESNRLTCIRDTRVIISKLASILT